MLDEEQAQPCFRRAVEAGINFFDTANVYSDGVSEEVTGRALREYARRDEVAHDRPVPIAAREVQRGEPVARGGGVQVGVGLPRVEQGR